MSDDLQVADQLVSAAPAPRALTILAFHLLTRSIMKSLETWAHGLSTPIWLPDSYLVPFRYPNFLKHLRPAPATPPEELCERQPGGIGARSFGLSP